MQEATGEVLVLNDVFCDGAGLAGGRSEDLSLAAAPAKLNEASFCQPANRDAAHDGGIHHGAGARPKADVLGLFAQLGQLSTDIEGLTGERGIHHAAGDFKGVTGDLLLLKLHDDTQQIGLRGRHHFAEGHLQIRAALQLKGDVLEQCGDGVPVRLARLLKHGTEGGHP